MSDPRYVKQLDLNHTGMVFKFTKKDNDFVHTDIEGQLVYSLGYTPSDIIGKTISELFPGEYGEKKKAYYLNAWEGKVIHYESMINGIHYIASLRPVIEGGKIVEVIGSCINIAEKTELQNSISIRNHTPTFLTSLSEDKLNNALQRATDQVNHTIRQASTTDRKNLIIKENNNIIFIPLAEIIFMERVDRKSIIHTGDKRYETYEALTSLHKQMNDNFIRSHKSYILNIDYLEIIEQQKGQKYIAHFKNYNNKAKISANLVKLLKAYKSN